MVAPGHSADHPSATPDVPPSSWVLRIVVRAMRTRLHDRPGTCAVRGEDTVCAPLRGLAHLGRADPREVLRRRLSGCARDTNPAARASAASATPRVGLRSHLTALRRHKRCRQTDTCHRSRDTYRPRIWRTSRGGSRADAELPSGERYLAVLTVVPVVAAAAANAERQTSRAVRPLWVNLGDDHTLTRLTRYFT
jgi:hypothetical protein